MQRRSTEAPNGGVFKMLIERGPRTGPFLSLASRGLAEKPELETSPVRGTRLIARGVNPTFHHQSVISHHQLTRFVSLSYSLYFNKEYHCNKNGAKQSSSWPGTPFWPISLKKISKKGAKKGGIPSSTKSGFQHPERFLIIKEVLLSCFEVKRDPE